MTNRLAAAIAKAHASRPVPVPVPIRIGDDNFYIETLRLDGTVAAALMADCPPDTPEAARLGYDVNRFARIASERYGRLLDADQNLVKPEVSDDGQSLIPLNWDAIFAAIDGRQLRAVAASWWALNGGQQGA